MRITTPAIVLALRSHGEHGAVVRLMTPAHGLQAAYVRGARGRRMRPVLMAGNEVEAQLAARTDTQLPQAMVELTHSRGPLLQEPLPAAAIEWACALTATALPEQQPYPQLHSALDGLLTAIEAAPAASGWGTALVRYELLLLAELGFGLDLAECAVTGRSDELVAVSPRSGRAVSAAEAQPYEGRLLRLPQFLLQGGQAGWADIADGLTLTGHFLSRDILTDRSQPLLDARGRLVERLRRAGGLA
ncbi:DNA repair protein RecO [Sphingomonas arenae]|uniref:DNA repair protein RecO n=1 Tax=Sphingomonas arenae TaxID=2812555 RepID=UPI0019673B34|nr:DNA repair protein RecO [Sphingomonas arenae]